MSKEETKIIDGKAIASELNDKIRKIVQDLNAKHKIKPGLAVVLISDNPASIIYVRNKVKKTVEMGMSSFEYTLPVDISEEILIKKIKSLNNDPKIHGILVQLPLPDHIDETKIINAIAPEKDVDGFHISNVGKLHTKQDDGFVPCTPLGCLYLLNMYVDNFVGKRAVIVGRSNIVGKPMAELLQQQNCTVTIVHSKTENIKQICQVADIVVVAIGKPNFVDKDWLKKGAVVIDVGINRIVTDEGKTKLVGDVDFESAFKVASAITPVPGGVGPMTIACLMYNTVKSACLLRKVKVPKLI